MTTVRRLTVLLLAALGLIAGYLATAAVAAASPAPASDGNGLPAVPVAPTGTPTSTIVTTGSPWWTFVLAAAAAIAVTVLAGMLIGKLRHRNAHHTGQDRFAAAAHNDGHEQSDMTAAAEERASART